MTGGAKARPVSARLVELGDAIVAAKQRARAAELGHREITAKVEQTTEAIKDAYAAGDEAKAAKLGRERAKLAGDTTPGERLEGAQRAVAKAEASRGLYASENADGLIAELEPDARAAAQAVEDAVEQLGAAHAAWSGVQSDVAALLRLAGRSTALPAFPPALLDLTRDARRAGGVGVPLPLPGQRAFATVAPHDDSDPAVW